MKSPNQYRVRVGPMASTDDYGPNGAYFVPNGYGQPPLKVIASDGRDAPEGLGGWEHVSVSLPDRCPTWDEMCRVKALFWGDEETVVQFHPARSSYVNMHRYCLHLWRPVVGELRLPPSVLVG